MKVLKLFGGFIGGAVVLLLLIWALLLLARFVSCGPNSADVKVMKPMAEKISDYIIKNGIPESLKDIPDLPYGLVGCENTSYYDKFDAKISNYIKVYSKEDADSKVITQECHFNYKSKKYSINFNGNYEFKYGGELIMRIENDTSRTGLQYFFKIDIKGNTHIDYKGNPYSSKTNGWCTQFKQ